MASNPQSKSIEMTSKPVNATVVSPDASQKEDVIKATVVSAGPVPSFFKQIQKYIDNDEKGMSLLKLVELIREDRIKDLGSDSLYFIIETLNKLKIKL